MVIPVRNHQAAHCPPMSGPLIPGPLMPMMPRRHGRRIGVLGGSFNPAHTGHIALSKLAKQHARLDEVWWLVNPQNPLKTTAEMASFQQRLAKAQEMTATLPFIKVKASEARWGTRRSYDSVRLLRQRLKGCVFIWIMGTDNLVQLPQWHRAKEFVHLSDSFIARRPGSFYQALASQGAHLYRHRCRHAASLGTYGRYYVGCHFQDSTSATAIRSMTNWPPHPLHA